MVSGALDKISRLCPLSNGPSDEGIHLNFSLFGALAAAPVAHPSIHH
jgi:hypothetical protein